MTKVNIYAYNGYLIIDTIEPEKHHEDCVINLGKISENIVCHTDKNLGISEEALILLRDIKIIDDVTGDIDLYQSENDGPVFRWIGGHKQIFNPKEIEASVDYNIDKFYKEEKFIIVDNNISIEAIMAINELIG